MTAAGADETLKQAERTKRMRYSGQPESRAEQRERGREEERGQWTAWSLDVGVIAKMTQPRFVFVVALAWFHCALDCLFFNLLNTIYKFIDPLPQCGVKSVCVCA